MGGRSLALSSKQSAAVSLLALGLPYSVISEQLGINDSTISRWLRVPRFASELAWLRRCVFQHNASQIAAAASDAIATLRHLCTDPNTAPAVRATAAGKLLDASLKTAQIDSQWDPISTRELLDRLKLSGVDPDTIHETIALAYGVDLALIGKE